MESGIYIYGIIRTDTIQQFGKIGLKNQEPAEVITLGVKNIAAVTSRYSGRDYNAQKKEEIIKDLVVHQAVLEQVMKRFTVLPVKFGTVAETESAVKAFLEDGYTLLSHELSKAEGKIEIDVVARWEMPKVLASLSAHNEQIRNIQQGIAAKGVDAKTEDKMLLGRTVEQALQQEEVRVQRFLLDLLKKEAVDVTVQELENDEMVLNAAFLLERENEDRFYTAIQAGDEALESLINFRIVGPLPLYSFSTVLLEKRDPQRIEEAKKVLGLTGKVTDKALRNAYYQGAKHFHPDSASQDAPHEFSRLREAHQTLKDFLDHGWISIEIRRWQEEQRSSSS